MFNWFKTMVLMAGMMCLFGILGFSMGGTDGMVMALVMGGAMNLYMYWNSDKMVLKQYSAKEVSEASEPEFYAIDRKSTRLNSSH